MAERNENELCHWADAQAARIIKEKGEREITVRTERGEKTLVEAVV